MESATKKIIDEIRSNEVPDGSGIFTILLKLDGPDYEFVDGPQLRINVNTVTDEMYREIPEALIESGFGMLRFESMARWISDDPCPEKAVVKDHVACHVENFLTGSDEARTGKAFIDMRGAYRIDSVDEPGVVLWHSRDKYENLMLPDDELNAARDAGCDAASPYIAEWVIGAKRVNLPVKAIVDLISD